MTTGPERSLLSRAEIETRDVDVFSDLSTARTVVIALVLDMTVHPVSASAVDSVIDAFVAVLRA